VWRKKKGFDFKGEELVFRREGEVLHQGKVFKRGKEQSKSARERERDSTRRGTSMKQNENDRIGKEARSERKSAKPYEHADTIATKKNGDLTGSKKIREKMEAKKKESNTRLSFRTRKTGEKKGWH